MAQAAEDKDGTESRSGRYPGVSLEDALSATEKLYKAEKRAPVDNATAARHMGYKSLSGPARVMIGALRQYGLIARVSDGRFKLSKLSIEALHGTETQKTAARKQAGLSPALFSELSKQHLGASEDNIRSYLITQRGFIDRGARIAAKAFRETVQFANVIDSGYDVSTDGGIEEINAGEFEDRPMDQTPTKPDATNTAIPPLSWVLSVPRGVRAELRIVGKDVTKGDLQRLKQQIDFLVASFEDGESS